MNRLDTHTGPRPWWSVILAFVIAIGVIVGLTWEMTAEIDYTPIQPPITIGAYFDEKEGVVKTVYKDANSNLFVRLPNAEERLEDIFKQDVIVAEGQTHTVYADTRGNLTVGIGHEVTPADKLKLGDKVTDEQIDKFYKRDYAKVVESLDKHFPKWKSWHELAQLAVMNFLYQLGPDAPKTFPRATTYLNDENWNEAADEWLWADQERMRHSRWYHETPARCQQEVNRLRAVAKTKAKEL